MSVPVSVQTKPGLCASLGGVLRLVGVGKFVLAFETLALAFTGYDTPRPVNVSFLLIGVNLLVLGWACLAAGRAFGRAAGVESMPSALAEALERMKTIFGYYLFLIGLAVLGLGVDLAMFLSRVFGR